MTIPYYNEDILPCISYPMSNSSEIPKRYLGSKAITHTPIVEIETIAKTGAEMSALHDFWELDCNYGLDPFVIGLPIFGDEGDGSLNFNYFLVRFMDDTKDVKDPMVWKSKRKMKVLAEVYVIVDDAGNIVVSDGGNLLQNAVITDIDYSLGEVTSINGYKQIIYNGADPVNGGYGFPIPVYDQTILPCISHPMTNTREEATRYLGNRAITGGVYAEFNIAGITNAQVKALYDFWRNDCKQGLEPFILNLPMFGKEFGGAKPSLLMVFDKSIKDIKQPNKWDIKRSVRLIGNIVYTMNGNDFVLSDSGQFIFSETGDYLAITSKLHTNKEITYGLY
tara:strand:- start:2851 stop:3858 length:1008 start_codon:yes stop_codon:yes gene_type:complete